MLKSKESERDAVVMTNTFSRIITTSSSHIPSENRHWSLDNHPEEVYNPQIVHNLSMDTQQITFDDTLLRTMDGLIGGARRSQKRASW